MSKLRDPGFYKYEPERQVTKLNQNNKDQSNNKKKYEPYPHSRPGPKLDDKRRTDIRPDVKLRKFNKAAHPVQNLDQIMWEDIKAVELSDGGSQGVIFVETDKGAVVVKGSTDCAIEYYLQKLSSILKITVPQMKVVNWQHKEFRTITNEIERAVFSDELLHYRVKPRLDMAYLIIMEYIPGITIEGMGVKRASRIFTHLTPESRDRLIRLGFILVFDTFINNYDRYPCGSIWDNDGNAGNIIVRAKTTFTSTTEQLMDPNEDELQYDRFYALDPRISLVNVRSDHTQEMLYKYYEKVELFLNDIFMELKEIMEAKIDPFRSEIGQKLGSIKKLTTFLFNYTGYQLKEMQVLQVMIGIGIGMHNIVELNIDRVGQLFIKQFIQDKTKDYRGYWNKNLEQINVEVLADVLKIYVKLSGVYPDVIKWLHDITFGEYKVNIIDWEKAMGIWEGNEDDENQQVKEQYMGKDLDSDDEEDKVSKYTNEDYDQDDDLKRKINDFFYLDVNQLEDDVKKGRDTDHYNKSTIQLAQMKPDKYEN